MIQSGVALTRNLPGKILLSVIGLLILAGFVVLLQPSRVMRLVSKYPGSSLLGVVILFSGSYGIRFLKWTIYLKVRPIPFFRVFALQVLAGSLTPFRLGEVTHIPLLGRDSGESLSRRTGRFLFLRAVELGIFLVFVVISSFFLGLYVTEIQWSLLALFILAAVLFLTIRIFLNRSRKAGEFLREVASVFRNDSSPSLLFVLIFLTLMQHLLIWGSLLVAVRALAPCRFVPVVAGYFVAQFAGGLSCIPGGLGVETVSWAYLVHLSGVPMVAAGSAALVHKCLTQAVIFVVASFTPILPRARQYGLSSQDNGC